MDMYHRIEKLLHEKNMSLVEMCRQLKISYSSYITNRSLFLELDHDVVARIAQFLHVSVEYLHANEDISHEFGSFLLSRMSSRKYKILEKISFLDEESESFEALEDRVDYLYRKTIFANSVTVA